MSCCDAQRSVHARPGRVGLVCQPRELSWRQRHARDARPTRRSVVRCAQPRPLRRRRCIARATAERPGRRLPRRSIPKSPRTTSPRHTPAEGTPADWSLKLIWSLSPGGNRQPACCGAARCPADCSDRKTPATRGRSIARFGTIRDARNGSAAAPIIPAFTRSASIRAITRHVLIGVSCGGVWRTRDDGRTWDIAGQGMRAEYMPPERQFDPNVQDPHLVVAVRRDIRMRCGCSTTTGSSGRPTAPHRGDEIKDVKPSVFGFPVAVHPRDPNTAWFVPAIKDEKRYPAGRLRRRQSHARWRQDVRDADARASRRNTPTISSSGTRSTSTRPAIVWRSARRPDRSGSARTAAIPGAPPHRICRRFTRCASRSPPVDGGRSCL